jgi:hypothetical protein
MVGWGILMTESDPVKVKEAKIRTCSRALAGSVPLGPSLFVSLEDGFPVAVHNIPSSLC